MKTVHDHYVEIKFKTKGPPTRAAFEDIRLKPNQNLTETLMDYPVDEITADDHEGEGRNGPRDDHGSIADIVDTLQEIVTTE